MFLSIIIPVYNAEKYICDCLDSCLKQDIPMNEYEIICVDDCSTDGSLDILHNYEKKHKNIYVISFSENRGVSASRNAGLEQMHGDYCIFLDADDFLADNCFSKIKSIIAEAGKNTILCVGRYHFEENGCSDRHDNYKIGEYFGCPTASYITNAFIPSNLASKLRFQENIAYGEDEIFNLELKMLNSKFLVLDEPIYYYRQHMDSAMSLTDEKRIKRLNSAISSALYIRKKYDLREKQISFFFAERVRIVLNNLYKLPFHIQLKYICYLKALNLVTLKKNDKVKKVSLFKYIQRNRLFLKNEAKDMIFIIKNKINKICGKI